MVEQPHKVPDYLSDAFRQAVWRFHDWRPKQPEPCVYVERSDHSMSTVCALVSECDDRLPDEVFDHLFFRCMDDNPRYRFLKEKLGAERTYAAGAQCLLVLIEERQGQGS